MTTNDKWPARPAAWPELMTEVELCLFLRLDEGRTVAGAKRSLRYFRSHQGLPCAGRIGRRVLFQLASVQAWLADREAARKPLQTPMGAGVAKETGVFLSEAGANTVSNAPIAGQTPISTTKPTPAGRTDHPRAASGGHGRQGSA